MRNCTFNLECFENQNFNIQNSQIYNKNYNLEIEPKPETLFRVFIITFQRKGFTVVEWGMELSKDCLSGR